MKVVAQGDDDDDVQICWAHSK